jgi:hypothetical protein
MERAGSDDDGCNATEFVTMNPPVCLKHDGPSVDGPEGHALDGASTTTRTVRRDPPSWFVPGGKPELSSGMASSAACCRPQELRLGRRE